MSAEPYPFAPAFERVVIALLVTSTRFYDRVGPYIEPDRFRDAYAKRIAAEVRALYNAIKRAPGSDAVVLQRLRALHERGKLSIEDLEGCAEYLIDAIEGGTPDIEVVIHEVAEVLKRKEQEATLDEAFSKFAGRASLNEVAKRLERAELIGKADVSYGVGLDDFAQELDTIGKLDRLSTGFRELDAELGGGTARGEFAFWLAGTKVGKSMALVQNAAMGLQRGLHVAVATLELDHVKWRARVLGTLTATPYQDIIDHGSNSVAFERYRELKNDPEVGLGVLTMQKFGGHQTTFEQVAEWVEREEERVGKRVELLVIDYADKLVGPDTSEGQYEQMKHVYEGIRLWAQARNVWAWSASQAQRVKPGEMPTINHCADSQHKVRVTDMMAGLTRDPETGNVRAKILALRNGAGDGAETSDLPNGFMFGCFVKNAVLGIEITEALEKAAETEHLGIFG